MIDSRALKSVYEQMDPQHTKYIQLDSNIADGLAKVKKRTFVRNVC